MHIGLVSQLVTECTSFSSLFTFVKSNLAKMTFIKEKNHNIANDGNVHATYHAVPLRLLTSKVFIEKI